MNETSETTLATERDGGLRQPAVLAWLRLARVYQKVERATAAFLREWDLTVAQFDILAQLRANEGMTQQQLADRLLVTKGNISQILAKMERRGLLRRHPVGRAFRLFLTPAGCDLAERVVPRHERCVAAQFATLPPEEQRLLLDLLRQLDHALPGGDPS